MDTMEIKSPLMTKVVSKAAASAIQSKTGYPAKVNIKHLIVNCSDQQAKASISLDISTDKETLIKLLKEFDLI